MLTRSQVATIRNSAKSLSDVEKQSWLDWFCKLASETPAKIDLAKVPMLVFCDAYALFQHQANCHEFDAKRGYHAQNLLCNRMVKS